MLVIKNKYLFDKENALTHITIPFKLNENFDKLIIDFKYSPSITPTEVSKPIIDNAVNKFMTKEKAKEMDIFINNINLENLITTSVKHDDYYVGGWHNKSNEQKIEISKNYSSLGYEKHDITKGFYKVVLSLHSINCPVEVSLKVEVF